MSLNPVICLQNVSKSFFAHARTDASLLSRIADLAPSGSKRLHAKYIEAVRDVSFSVSKGEVLGIIGCNAAGKTTVLRLIAGIFAPDTGTVSVSGNVISLINLSVGLRDRLTVRDNISFSCSLYGLGREDINDVFPRIIEFAGIEEYVDMYPYQLSLGMTQRLAFSIAIHTKPEILLLDEVFSAGDIHFQEKAAEKMKEMIRSDVTVVMVSHQLDHIRMFCDSVLWMEHGSIRELGSPQDVVAHYMEPVSAAPPRMTELNRSM